METVSVNDKEYSVPSTIEETSTGMFGTSKPDFNPWLAAREIGEPIKVGLFIISHNSIPNNRTHGLVAYKKHPDVLYEIEFHSNRRGLGVYYHVGRTNRLKISERDLLLGELHTLKNLWRKQVTEITRANNKIQMDSLGVTRTELNKLKAKNLEAITDAEDMRASIAISQEVRKAKLAIDALESNTNKGIFNLEDTRRVSKAVAKLILISRKERSLSKERLKKAKAQITKGELF